MGRLTQRRRPTIVEPFVRAPTGWESRAAAPRCAWPRHSLGMGNLADYPKIRRTQGIFPRRQGPEPRTTGTKNAWTHSMWGQAFVMSCDITWR